MPEFEFGSQRSKVKVIRDKNDKVWHFFLDRSSRARSSGAMRAVYVWENIFSIAGVAGMEVGHATTSVSK